jgi:TPP-dependent pyruvate/acetoin dehydrogenase alpha subunit
MSTENHDILRLNYPQSHKFYFQMRMIRTVEEALLDLFSANEVFGTTHTCLGQEADAVAVLNAIDRERDLVWSNHRCHGHFIAYCGNVHGLIAEIMGRQGGVCGGRGGSQHLHWHNFASTGVQGGLLPAALGGAYAEKSSGAISVVFLGDGTMGEGIVYECLNMAALWSLPVLIVVEDNGIAQTTPGALGIAGSITDRAGPFGIRSMHYKGTDADELHILATEAVDYVRLNGRPLWLHIETVRLGPHSKGDDTRGAVELEALRRHDPLLLYRTRVSDPDLIDSECRRIVEQAVEEVRRMPIACG